MNTRSTQHKVLLPATAVTAAVLLAGACGGTATGSGARTAQSQPCVHVVDEDTGRPGPDCLLLAPAGDRVDLTEPRFTHPTPVTNPLHPTSEVDQTIYGGQVDGKPFRTEVSTLPGTKKITLDDGTSVQALIQQYAAYSDGRVQEVALDWFAQADDGSVWYLGEDVFNYEDGVVADTDGTWMAGRDGAPAAMIMPARPEKGDVYRPENLPEVVFEEVTVRAVDQTVDGPYGKVEGAMTVRELHMDGSTEDKVFAPGYGEFSTGGTATEEGDLEAVSLAVPTDAKSGPVPAGLTALERAVRAAHTDPGAGTARAARAAWTAYRASDDVPALLERQMNRDLDTLAKAPENRSAALRVAQNTTDLRLRYESVRTVDADRFALWARQLGIDAAAGDAGAVAGDVTALELAWERLREGTPAAAANTLTTDLAAARDAADREDVTKAGQLVPRLLADIGRIGDGERVAQ
ncbi:hypothetical protein [Streptomyces sp. GQFP]|uniref:hypothetical protein n=1 Tax=Streptomyces sp. GQFP TaxID=2907545 RepID=UPI001F17DEAE|nr:hypothetical protein [Streptomyces sp. GQFP]UIX34847.1 hypothetical protein LUX31_35290 [Streptomyces sp. GQFP]